jgi:hypothetical protein
MNNDKLEEEKVIEEGIDEGFWTSSIGKFFRWIIFLPIALLSAILINLLATFVNIITGEPSDWVYLNGVVVSRITFIYVSFFIVPNFHKFILYALFVLQVFFSIAWIYEPSASPLNLGMLILQEVMVLGGSFLLIRKLLSGELFNEEY